MLALLGMTQMAAQESDYLPFVREGVKWVYKYHSVIYPEALGLADGEHYYSMEFKGEVEINGKMYKPVCLNKIDYNKEETPVDYVPAYVREEDRVVYAIVLDARAHPECPVGFGRTMCDTEPLESYYVPGEEFVLYDFNDPSTIYGDLVLPVYSYSDTYTIGKHECKVNHYELDGSDGEHLIIEGYGNVNESPLFYFQMRTTGFQVSYRLSHIIEDGEVVYRSRNYNEDWYLPINREGVKWVNERVVVDHGEMTRTYYTYEFKGMHPVKPEYGTAMSACYYYLGNGKHVEDPANDVIMAGVHDFWGDVESNENVAMNKVVESGRNMLDLESQSSFGYLLYTWDTWANLGEYYMSYQREPFLNSGNFIKTSPVVVDGCICDRWAYLGEDGEPLAYVVEGIGFDSRDLGDLLTPFTRKPDPDADYQEWCGLSHVMKDGKIIYKGMRYSQDNMTGIDEVVADKGQRAYDGTYYNLMGQPVGKEVPTTPGIYIHNGNKILVR